MIYTKPMFVLGFDFGKKKIGVALGQTITRTASPLCLIQAINGVPSWDKMDALFTEWNPIALVVGLPYHANGADSPLVGSAKAFAIKLHARYQRPYYFVDEHLTSVEARQLIAQYKSKVSVDALAAMLILSSWLESAPI